MFEMLIDNINQLYQVIIQPFDDYIKLKKVHSFLKKYNISGTIGEYYYDLTGINKGKGLVYTPYNIAQYMIKNTIDVEYVIKNPNVKIFDPSCGIGNFLIPIYNYLFDIFSSHYDTIKDKICCKDIKRHIIENNIWGYDIDEFAIKIFYIDMYRISGYVPINITNGDFLFDEIRSKFDIIIGNPPYIGHKSINAEYSKSIKEKYEDVYNDKADISYCFFSKAMKNISNDGKVTFLTSRYFMESPSGKGLRRLLSRYNICKIIDFYGIRPFKKVGIDPVIIFVSNIIMNKNNLCNVKRPAIYDKKFDFVSEIAIKNSVNVKNFYISRKNFNDETWLLIPNEERNIIKKIEKQCTYTLGDICNSYQGIITGCDKAFIIDDIDGCSNIERDLIRRWVKNSNIKKGHIEYGHKYIIYSNFIDDEKKYPNAIRHIENYKEKLIQRRECKKGAIKWYELQWGRDRKIFEGEKIIFPYKASENRFSIDKGSFFSADIYSLVLKDNHFSLSYKVLEKILNCKLYEYYFQSYGKKLGGDLYEYYPNTVCRLKIPEIKNEISDESIFEYFHLTSSEIKIVCNKFEK